MLTIMITLLGISILLVIISFFLRDPVKDLREDLDQLSIQQVQEMYKLKKKMKVLEEELMLGEQDFTIDPVISNVGAPVIANIDSVHAIIKNQVWTLASQGVPIDRIANQSSLSTAQVQQIMKEREGELR